MCRRGADPIRMQPPAPGPYDPTDPTRPTERAPLHPAGYEPAFPLTPGATSTPPSSTLPPAVPPPPFSQRPSENDHFNFPDELHPIADDRSASLGRYLVSREFILTLVLFGLGLVAALAIVFFIVLPVYTGHGDSVAVPKVTDMNLERANTLLESRDLSMQVIDSQYIGGKPPLSVITQEPPAGQDVKPGRVVYLVINKTSPPDTKLPDIVDVNLQQGRYLLESWGLKVGRISYQPSQETDLILKATQRGRELKAGDLVKMGSSIDLLVSQRGSGANVVVPNLSGMSLGEASSKLADLGLALGTVRYGSSPSQRENGIVFQHSPSAEEGVPAGTAVDLWVTGQPQQPLDAGAADDGGTP